MVRRLNLEVYSSVKGGEKLMGSARTEITGLIMQPIGNDVFHTTETGSKQWFAMCHADEVAKLIELNQ